MSKAFDKLDWVQALRGGAALMVVLSHGRDYLIGTPGYPEIERVLVAGAMGVDLFFIVSGFIMVYSTKDTGSTLADVKDFAVKRFCRVWPTYTVVTVLWVLIAEDGARYFASAANWLTFFKSIFFIPVKDLAPLYFAPIIPLGWTLNFEMYFYAIFAVSLFFGRYRSGVMICWVVATVIVFPVIAKTLSMNPFHYYEFRPNYLNLMANSIILEFVAGALVARLYLAGRVRIASRAVAFNFISCSVGFAIWWNFNSVGGQHGIAGWGLPLLLVFMSVALASKTINIKVPRVLVWLGEISYSLYLTHYLTRIVLDRIVSRYGYGEFTHAWTYLLMTVFICIAAAALSHYLLEQKLSRVLQKGFHNKKTTVNAVRRPPDTAE